MYPSSFKMRAISAFSFDAGTSTLGCRAASALRRRVNISAIGSVTIRYPLLKPSKPLPAVAARNPLPTRLGHAGDLALQGELAEAQPAQRETAQITTRTPAAPAAAPMAGVVPRPPPVLCDVC